MRKESIFLTLFVIRLLCSCGPTDEDRARVRMNFVQQLLQQHDTLNALAHLDSIPRLYPKAVYSANAAQNLRNEIVYQLLKQKISALEVTEKSIPQLSSVFEAEKTEFDRYSQYTHKRQRTDNSWDRSFLRVNLDERGEISLTSYYFGNQWLDHTAIRVYDQGDAAKTTEVALGSVDNHHSGFMETKLEKVTYRGEKNLEVIQFIASNTGRRLKAAFIGKRNYYIVLEEFDKSAFRDAILLSEALKKKTTLEKEIKALQKSLNLQ